MSSYELKGKIAIVTGAGSGINHALTELLLEAGCSVVMADVRLRPEAQQTLDRYPHHPGNKDNGEDHRPSAVFQPTDTGNWAQIRALWETALQTYGRVNIVVNGAGVYEPPSSTFWNPPESSSSLSSPSPGVGVAPVDDPDAAVGQYQTFAINTTGPIRLAQIAVEYWLQHPELQGNMLFFASVAGYVHGLLTPLYFASKAAIISFAKSLGGLREHCGIRSACICPSTVHVCTLGTRLPTCLPLLLYLFLNRFWLLLRMVYGDVFASTNLSNLLSILHTKYRQTPLIHEIQKHVNVRPDDLGLTGKECAEVAMRLLQEPQYGGGEIIECMKAFNVNKDEEGGDETVIQLREVPVETLYPSFYNNNLDTIMGDPEKKLIQRLQQGKMRAAVE
ncbi:short chain dehydrogenase reductase [Apiospora arundinis]